MSYNKCPEAIIDTRHCQMGWHISCVFVTTMHSKSLGELKTHRAQHGSVHGIHTRRIQQHALSPQYLKWSSWYCSTRIRATLSWVDVIQALIGAVSPRGRKCNIYCTRECRLPADRTDTSLWRCRNCSCGEAHAVSHGNWDCPNRESSKYFMTINRFHTTTGRAPICAQAIVHYGWNFANGHITRPLRMSSFYITKCNKNVIFQCWQAWKLHLRWSLVRCLAYWCIVVNMCMCSQMISITQSKGKKEHSSHNKTKEGQLDWARIA
jgi:hypothetical protein